ncbi:MAG: hypothetical protein WAV32_00950 [Halobacteriota archaeon]
MGEVEVKRERVTRHEFRHDRHTVSLLTDPKTFKKVLSKTLRRSPKYRGKVLEGEVAETVYIGAEGLQLRENKHYTGSCDRRRKGKSAENMVHIAL